MNTKHTPAPIVGLDFKKYTVRCSTVGFDLLEGEIMTSYEVKALNETHAKHIAKFKFKCAFPSADKVEMHILRNSEAIKKATE